MASPGYEMSYEQSVGNTNTQQNTYQPHLPAYQPNDFINHPHRSASITRNQQISGVTSNQPPIATGYQQPGQNSKEQYSDYGQPPPYYPPANTVYPMQTTSEVITVQPSYIQRNIVVQPAYVPQPPSYMCLSCCTFFFINILCGAIAIVFSIASYASYDKGNLQQARTHGKVALCLNLIGLVTTIILITTLVIIFLI